MEIRLSSWSTLRSLLLVAAVGVAPILLSGCSGEDRSPPTVPVFDDVDLQQGRTTWMQVCRNCHLLGVAGAPAISDAANWAPRIAKGKEALYHSAMNGIPRGEGWGMPPRGGNAKLSDREVRQAVDFMVATVEYLQQQGD
jgi:cytochrome c5